MADEETPEKTEETTAEETPETVVDEVETAASEAGAGDTSTVDTPDSVSRRYFSTAVAQSFCAAAARA